MSAKTRVSRREYNRWTKWLRAKGYSGPFAGLKTSHECVKLLAKELRKDPPTILETRPRDPRTIVSALNRYGRKKSAASKLGVLQDLSMPLEEVNRMLTGLVRLTGSGIESRVRQDLPVVLYNSILRSFGCYHIEQLKLMHNVLSLCLGRRFDAWIGKDLKNIESSLGRRRTIQEQIATDAKSGCKALSSVEFVDNNFALAAYHFLIRGDETWLEEDRFQVQGLDVGLPGSTYRRVWCSRYGCSLTLDERDMRRFICPWHDVPMVESPPSPPSESPVTVMPPYEESVSPIEHIAWKYHDKASLSLRIPKMLPFSELVIAVGETASMPKLTRFLQDFLRASLLREKAQRNEDGLRISFTNLLETLRSAPATDAEQSDGDNRPAST